MSGVLIRWIVLGLMLAGAAACQRKPAGDDTYFPLAAGRTWTYTMARDGMEEGEQPIELKVESLGPEEVSGRARHAREDRDGRRLALPVRRGGRARRVPLRDAVAR